MRATKGIHPPAGATTFLAVVDPSIVALGWLTLPLTLFGCLMIEATDFLIRKIEQLLQIRTKAGAPCLGPPTPKVVVRRGYVSVPEGFNFSEEEESLVQRLSSYI